MTIEEHLEQFVKDYWKWDDDYKDTTLYLDTRILLRQVVEECCEAMCKLCRGENHGYHNKPEKHGSINTLVHWSNTEMAGWLVCHADDIRSHFDWLLEK